MSGTWYYGYDESSGKDLSPDGIVAHAQHSSPDSKRLITVILFHKLKHHTMHKQYIDIKASLLVVYLLGYCIY